jgi:hypothetical protein
MVHFNIGGIDGEREMLKARTMTRHGMENLDSWVRHGYGSGLQALTRTRTRKNPYGSIPDPLTRGSRPYWYGSRVRVRGVGQRWMRKNK